MLLKRMAIAYPALFTSVSTTVVDPNAVTIINPPNGAVVAGWIHVDALVPAGTVRVDFYRDGILFKSVTNGSPESPSVLRTIP